MSTIKQRIAKINAECSGVWGQSGVSSWERDRLKEWADRETLTDKQLGVLRTIESKVFGGEN